MAEWLIAMVLALGVGLIAPAERWQRVRVWAAMMAAFATAYIYPNVWFYLAIDIVTAAIIMWPPKTLAQRIIGLCYVGMVLLTTGYAIRDVAGVYIFSSAANSPELLKGAHDFLGWAAVVALFSWGAGSALGAYRNSSSNSGNMVPAKQRRVR